MIAIQLIKEIVKKEVPNYNLLSDRKKDRVIRDILSDNLELIVQKIKLPRPPSKFRIILEQLRDKRRSKNALTRKKPVNYYLWSLLYAVKSNIQKSVASNFLSAFGSLNDGTTTTLQNISIANTSIISQYDQILDTDRDYSTKIIPYFQIEEKLEKRVIDDQTFGQFVSCLDEVCLEESKNDPNLEFGLEERKDPEIPEWNKLILNVKFYDDLVTKLQKFKKLQSHIDNSLDGIKNDIDAEKLNLLLKSFYIKLVS